MDTKITTDLQNIDSYKTIAPNIKYGKTEPFVIRYRKFLDLYEIWILAEISQIDFPHLRHKIKEAVENTFQIECTIRLRKQTDSEISNPSLRDGIFLQIRPEQLKVP